MSAEWSGNLEGFMAEHLESFRPYAFYDKHMDCIRVKILDCSVTEKRMSRIFTLLTGNHLSVPRNVGFTIKGVAHLFNRLGLKQEGAHDVAHILDEIVRVFPDAVVKKVSEEFAPVVREKGLTVSFDEQIMEAAA